MAMSAGTIVVVVFLVTVIGVIAWYFFVAYKYRQTLNKFSYTRGANLDTKDKNKGVVNLACESGAEICVWKATAICTGPLKGSVSNSEGGPEPISNGLNNNSAYGDFDINNTIDLTVDMATQANGKQTYAYNFDVTKKNFGKATCPMNYDSKSGTGVRPQLISTYACIPKGSQCQSSKPPTPPNPPPTPPAFFQLGNLTGSNAISMNNKNQICSVNNTTKMFQCVDSYNVNPQLNTFPGYASQLSLSDNGSLFVSNSAGAIYYKDNFKTGNFTQYTVAKPSLTVTNRFSPAQQMVAGSTVGMGQVWSVQNGNLNNYATYNWTYMDSNSNGDMAGVAYQGGSNYTIQYLAANAQSPIPVTAPFTPTQVSIDGNRMLCATTTKGDIMCTNSITSPNWYTVSTGKNYVGLTTNDSGTICGVRGDGSVWCTA